MLHTLVKYVIYLYIMLNLYKNLINRKKVIMNYLNFYRILCYISKNLILVKILASRVIFDTR